MKMTKRFLCLMLALFLLMEYIPGALPARATQEDGICATHHAVHDVNICGYAAEVQGSPCGHEETCDDACKQEITECLFSHADCGCTEESSCTHQCTVGNGCITMVCSHKEHDNFCGYVEAVEAHACRFAGVPCQQCANEKKLTPASDDGVSQLFKTDVFFDTDPNKVNKVYFKLYFGTDPEDMSKNTEIIGTDAVSIKEAHQNYVCNFGYNEAKGCWSMEFLRPNHPTDVVYTVADTSYTVSFEYRIPEYLQCMLFDDPQCIIGDTWYVPEGNSYDNVKFFLGTDMYVDLSDPITSGLTFENNNGAIVFSEEEDGVYSIEAMKQDASAKVIYQAGEETYELEIIVTEPDLPCLRYWLNENDPPRSGPWRMALDFEDDVKFYIGTNSETAMDTDDTRYSLDVTVKENDGVIALTPKDNTSGWYTIKALKGGEATIRYIKDNTEYTLQIIVEEPQFRMIPVQPTGNPNWIDLSCVEGPVDLRCYLAEMNGPPVGAPLVNVTSSDESIFTLSVKNAQAGVYTLTPVGAGVAQLCYTVGDKLYTTDVIVLDKDFKAEGLVYYRAVHGMSGKTFPCTVVSIPVDGGIAKEFYYSQSTEAALLSDDASGMVPLTIDDVDWSGPIEVVQPEDDTRLHIIGTAVGTGYLEVTSDDGIVHCFVVNVGMDRPNTEIQEGGYMWLNQDTVLGFGNPGIASAGDNNAEAGVLKLRSQVNSGFGSIDYPEEFIYREPVAFAAMNQTDGKPNADIMSKVKNVEFSILACQNTDGSSGSYASVEKAACEQIALTEGNVKAWTNYIVAGGTDAFRGLVGMTFDLPDTRNGQSITRRISLYILMHNTYMGEEVLVEANVITAKQLNVILSSYEALKTWIKQEYPVYADTVDKACNVDIVLPGIDLTDAVVVSEAIAPFPFRPNPSSNPNFRIYLRAANNRQKPTLAGLISRGSLAGIFDVNFKATEGVAMTMGEERFTCGLLADSEWSGIVEYDMAFAQQYGIDPYANKRNLSSWRQDGDMKYADCDILSVDGCSFEGFDYGTRSTPNGYVGGGVGNSFKNCYFGIYIDCAGKPGWGDIHYTGFSGYDFKKNVAAVRIVGLQENITPYEFRIYDSDFINNYLEFWINDYDTTYLQNYYFYRNHYRGGWKLNSGNGGGDTSSGYGWVKHKGKAPNDEDLPDVHRGPRYQVQDGDTIVNNGVAVNISGTPGKAVPNLAVNSRAATEGYWIYDGEDQLTRIELGGDALPLAQESLEQLNRDAEVSVVKNQGADIAAVWTFEGGE